MFPSLFVAQFYCPFIFFMTAMIDSKLQPRQLELQNKHLCVALMPLTVSRFHPNPCKDNTLAHEIAYNYAQHFRLSFASSPSAKPNLRFRTPDALREGLHNLAGLDRLRKNLEDAREAVSIVIETMESAVKESQVARHANPASSWDIPVEIIDMIFKLVIDDLHDVLQISLVCKQFRDSVKNYVQWSLALTPAVLGFRGNTDALELALNKNPTAPITANINTLERQCAHFLPHLMKHPHRFRKIKVQGRNEYNLRSLLLEGYDMDDLSTLHFVDTHCMSYFRCWRMTRLSDLSFVRTPLSVDIVNGTYPDSLKRFTIDPPKEDINASLPDRLLDFLRRSQVRSVVQFSLSIDFSCHAGRMLQFSSHRLAATTLKSLRDLHMTFAFTNVTHFRLCARLLCCISAPKLVKLHVTLIFTNESAASGLVQDDIKSLFFDGSRHPDVQEFRVLIETKSVPGLRTHKPVPWQIAPIVASFDGVRVFSLHTNVDAIADTPLYDLTHLEKITLSGAHFVLESNRTHFLSRIRLKHVRDLNANVT